MIKLAYDLKYEVSLCTVCKCALCRATYDEAFRRKARELERYHGPIVLEDCVVADDGEDYNSTCERNDAIWCKCHDAGSRAVYDIKGEYDVRTLHLVEY